LWVRADISEELICQIAWRHPPYVLYLLYTVYFILLLLFYIFEELHLNKT